MQKELTLAIEWWPIDQPRPYEGNPRIIPEIAVTKVAASLETFGWRQPIVVDEAGIVVVGHTRLLAAKKLNFDQVPVHVAAGLDPAKVRAYRLADNRTHEETSWNPDALDVELKALSEGSFDLELAGFDPVDIPVEAPEFNGIAEADVQPLDQLKRICCPHCGHEFVP